MKRFFKIAGIVIGSVFVIAILYGFFWFKDAILVEKNTPDELASILTPHFIIKHPPGDGPFPAVIFFHGAEGLFNPERDVWGYYDNWADYFASLGYASILVDSYTGRDLKPEKVQSGRSLWGAERAGDVLIAIDKVSKMPFVNPNQISLMGRSHGGWAIMSLLTLDLQNDLPPNLNSPSKNLLNGVRGAVFVIPYFHSSIKSVVDNWSSSIEALVLLGEKDPLTEAALKVVLSLKEKNNPVSYHVYPSVGHGLECTQEDLKIIKKYIDPNIKAPDPQIAVDVRRRVKEFLEEVFK